MLFSIIIPALNEEKYLPELLTDLANQAEKNFEVLVADASSEDNTVKEVKKFKGKYSLSVFVTERKNVAFSRNFGGEKARGEYLIFLDADVHVAPTFTKQLASAIQKNHGTVYVPNAVSERNTPLSAFLFVCAEILIRLLFFLKKPLSTGGNIIIRKDLFSKLGGFDEKIFVAEDHDLIQRAAKHGERVQFLPSVKIKASLRRLDKEGPILFWKYFVSTFLVLFRGKITKPIYKYEMGGQNFKKDNNKSSK